MRVKIRIISQTMNVEIDASSESNKLIFNGKDHKCNVSDFLERAIGIVRDWQERMEDYSILDGVEYRVTFDDGKGTIRDVSGYGKTPDNFGDLVMLIRETKPTLEDELFKMFLENINLDEDVDLGDDE